MHVKYSQETSVNKKKNHLPSDDDENGRISSLVFASTEAMVN